MRYFTWILGLGFALLRGLVNLLWLEARWAADEDLKGVLSRAILPMKRPTAGMSAFSSSCVADQIAGASLASRFSAGMGQAIGPAAR